MRNRLNKLPIKILWRHKHDKQLADLKDHNLQLLQWLEECQEELKSYQQVYNAFEFDDSKIEQLESDLKKV